MPIIGTAGHVDHGKSTLVLALTGRDPDRLAEEKERGLTIDLGFAWADIAGHTVGFVDVPGHERFIKNMLAGVGAVDVALLVVAADEGWMPQTEEHMSVLDALEVTTGVIAVTRTDLVDADTAELAALEAEDRVAGTVLEGWPIVTVSAVTGEGLDELRATLGAALDARGAPQDTGTPRMWIDRSFVISGAGVVVTGTLTGGSVARDDQLTLYPDGTPVRIRGIQSHEEATDTIGPGSRVALNVSPGTRDDAPRGAMLGPQHRFVVTDRLLAGVCPVRGLAEPLTDRGAYHLHIGTADVGARVRFLAPDIALITLTEPIASTMGDRFILREAGRRAVVAGGRILDPHPASRPDETAAEELRATLDRTANDRAAALLAAHGVMEIGRLDAASGGGVAGELVAGGTAFSADRVSALRIAANELVRHYQVANPMRAGIPRRSLATGLGIAAAALDAIAATSQNLIDDGATIRTSDFTAAMDDAGWEEARSTLAASLAVPRASQLGLDAEALHARIRTGDLVAIADDLVYLPEQVDTITAALELVAAPFTVSEFRDALGLSRRQAVPLLEWLDASGWTRRSGDVRTLRRPPNG